MDRSHAGVFGLAIIWAAVVIASALVLKDTECFGRMIPILGGGAAGSIVAVGGAARKKGTG